jgi:hypothetical protein
MIGPSIARPAVPAQFEPVVMRPARSCYRPAQREDEDALTQAVIELAGLWALRLPPDRDPATASRLAGGQGPGGAYLAS